MTCEFIADANLLYEYADGTLPDDQVEALEAHLETCTACREEETGIRSLMAQIATLPFGSESLDRPASVEELSAPALGREVNPDRKEITDSYVASLKVALAARDFKFAQALIDDHLDTLMTLDPDQKNAARLVGLFGRWTDMGYAHVGMGNSEPISRLEMLKNCLRLFARSPRPLMPLLDVTHLCMASGYAAFAERRHEDALKDFSFVVAALPEMGDRELGALAHYGIAKIYRRRGDYDKAEPHICQAIQLAQQSNRAEMEAGFSVLLAWLQFQRGDVKAAKELLRKAEAVLRETEDHLRLGNIQSVFGRIAQREGRYYDALRSYELALSEYYKWSPSHGNIGRTLVNRAFVKRLLALKTLRKGRKSESRRREAGRLRHNAGTDLEIALLIYAKLNSGRGQASVKVVSSLLYLDFENFDAAEHDAEEAYQLGIEKMDMIVAARARIVQCMTENARASNSKRGSSQKDACLERALTCAEEAIALAQKTQNKRLQARAHIWHGRTLLRLGGVSRRKAAKCYKLAKSLLTPPGESYAAKELQALEQKLAKPSRGSHAAEEPQALEQAQSKQQSTQLQAESPRRRSKVAPEKSTLELFAYADRRGK